MLRYELNHARWSVQDTMRFAAAVPISCLAGRAIVVLAPMMAVESGVTDWTPRIHGFVIDHVSYGSNAYVFLMACFNSAPAIALSMLLIALLGATNSKFGSVTGALIPLAVAAWSYYSLRDALMNSPLFIATVPAYLSLYVGRRLTSNADPNSQTMAIYRYATYLLVIILAVTSEIWWHRYWTPGLSH